MKRSRALSRKPFCVLFFALLLGAAAFFLCSAPTVLAEDDITKITIKTGNIGAEGDGSNVRYDYEVWGDYATEEIYYVLAIRGSGAMRDFSGTPFPLLFFGISSEYECRVIVEDGVTNVGSHLFEGLKEINSVSIGKDVEVIGESAFKGCQGLREIDFGSGAPLSIKSYAFSGCIALTELRIPPRVTQIADRYAGNAFMNCSVRRLFLDSEMEFPYGINLDSLEEVTLGEHMTAVPPGAFEKAPRLKKLTVPDNVTRVGDRAFYWCSALTSTDFLPDTVTEIGESAFSGCSGLTEAVLPKGLTVLGNSAFAGSGLVSIVLPDGLTVLGNGAFAGSGLVSIVLPDGLQTLGASVFSGCPALISAELPSALTEIPERTFNGCEALESVPIPESVEKIGALAFSKCTGLQKLVLPDSVTEIASDAFSGAECRILSIGTYLENHVVPLYAPALEIREPVKQICDRACNYWALQKVTFPDTLTEIGARAFQGSNLSEVSFPPKLRYVGNYAFASCPLTSVSFPDGMTSISDYAFYGCEQLSEIRVPDTVDNIGADAFSETAWYDAQPYGVVYIGKVLCDYKDINNSLINLKTLEVRPGTVGIASRVFPYCDLKTITLPPSLRYLGFDAFRAAGSPEIRISDLAAWCRIFRNNDGLSGSIYLNGELLEELRVPDGLDSIAPYAFYGFSSVKSLIVPQGVETIGEFAFSCCGLTSLSLPGSLRTIKYSAFQSCGSLKAVELPEGLETLGFRAFKDCVNLRWITMPDSLIRVDGEAFDGTAWFTYAVDRSKPVYAGKVLYYYSNDFIEKTFPLREDVRTVTMNAVRGPHNLKTVYLPEGLLEIGAFAFWDSRELTTVSLPSTLTKVGFGAFENCKTLAHVYYAGSREDWERIEFEEDNEELLNATIHFGHTHVPGDLRRSEQTDPTCREVGTVREDAVCALCGLSYCVLRVTPATGRHNPGSWSTLYDATCGKAGVEARFCSVCTFPLETRVLPPTGKHDVRDWTVTVPATDDREGEKTGVCVRCKATVTEAIPRLVGDPEGPDGPVVPGVTAETIGDLDRDGAVTASDARLALRAAVGLERFDEVLTDLADTDRDGAVTAADARQILRAAVGLEDRRSWIT